MATTKYPKIPHYEKNPYYEKLLQHAILTIEEKLDGSQFRIIISKDQGIIIGSKNQEETLLDANMQPGVEVLASMFQTAREQVRRLINTLIRETDYEELLTSMDGVRIYAEYLREPRHNTLEYERTPKNNLAIFDIYHPKDGWKHPYYYEELPEITDNTVRLIKRIINYFEPVRTITMNEKYNTLNAETLNSLIKNNKSMLGGTIPEGLVIKARSILIMNERRKVLEPVMFKYVRREFQEKNREVWAREKKPSLEVVLERLAGTLKSEARWHKAVQHLKEEGRLKEGLRAIPDIIEEAWRDILEEEKDLLVEAFLQLHGHKLKKIVTSSIPGWYKEYLATGMKE